MSDHNLRPHTVPQVVPISETAERMKLACERFLESLTPDLLEKVVFAFDASERFRWHYVPRELFDRKGLSLKEMDEKQRKSALTLMATGLSDGGYQKARSILDLETTLGKQERMEGIARLVRDPELCFFSIFGDPMDRAPWGWRAEGHHLSLHFTIVNHERISPHPFFFGANPAIVRHGSKKGQRILLEEEDIARQLLSNLTVEQKKTAIISSTAPDDIVTRELPKVNLKTTQGIAAGSMTGDQRQLMSHLLYVYIDRLSESLAKIERQRLRSGQMDEIHFAWAGSEEPGIPHYYRLHGTRFFAEYDNTQNNANHIHTVWRNLKDDFGIDLLNTHYRNGHHRT